MQRLLGIFAGRKAADTGAKKRAETAEGRLKDRIVDGDRKGLDDDLAEAMAKGIAPLDIINGILLDGMKVVGELFGAGKMQLPFVLQSAETMKAAVAYLEPHMERVEGQEKGTIVLATVKGDVHDIGKNLVDIILTNNGYRVVNLGIKVPLADMVAAAKEHRAHAIGMSGLLVKSTVVMRENLEEMGRQGLEVPVLLGGAALTRNYVEDDCVRAYACGRVAYARDAFDGLHLMDKVTGNGFDDYLAAMQAKRKGKARNEKRTLGTADPRGFAPGRCELRPGAAAAPHGRRAGPRSALLGCQGDRGRAQGRGALHQRAQPLPIPMGLPEAGPLAGGLPRLGEAGTAPGAEAHAGAHRCRARSSGRRRSTATGSAPARATTWCSSSRTAPPRPAASPCRASPSRMASASPTSCATSRTARTRAT